MDHAAGGGAYRAGGLSRRRARSTLLHDPLASTWAVCGSAPTQGFRWEIGDPPKTVVLRKGEESFHHPARQETRRTPQPPPTSPGMGSANPLPMMNFPLAKGFRRTFNRQFEVLAVNVTGNRCHAELLPRDPPMPASSSPRCGSISIRTIGSTPGFRAGATRRLVVTQRVHERAVQRQDRRACVRLRSHRLRGDGCQALTHAAWRYVAIAGLLVFVALGLSRISFNVDIHADAPDEPAPGARIVVVPEKLRGVRRADHHRRSPHAPTPPQRQRTRLPPASTRRRRWSNAPPPVHPGKNSPPSSSEVFAFPHPQPAARGGRKRAGRAALARNRHRVTLQSTLEKLTDSVSPQDSRTAELRSVRSRRTSRGFAA